jgi:hypothetical protein
MPGIPQVSKAVMVRSTLFSAVAVSVSSATVDTIFRDTRKPLVMWFPTMSYVTSQKSRAKALELDERVLGLVVTGRHERGSGHRTHSLIELEICAVLWRVM